MKFKKIPITNILKEVTSAYRKLARLYYPGNWNTQIILSKSESTDKFKGLVNAYDDIIVNVRLL